MFPLGQKERAASAAHSHCGESRESERAPARYIKWAPSGAVAMGRGKRKGEPQPAPRRRERRASLTADLPASSPRRGFEPRYRRQTAQLQPDDEGYASAAAGGEGGGRALTLHRGWMKKRAAGAVQGLVAEDRDTVI